ncbi:beta-1,3-glucanase family protein [Streptomyces sp. B6B3]|uniref:beta-1,3-glucanase family protein n=1 Tax=Streptomyces sp. B6B3 TaxID=3153570 RepID=UPI00325E6798
MGATALAARPGAGRAAAAAPLPVTVVNNTGQFDNASIWVYIVGNDGQRQVRVTPDGQLLPVSTADNGADGYTDYAIPLAASGDTTIPLPYMSGRIYVALGDKLKFKALADGNGNPALAYPAGWVSSDPNYPVLHDCAEFTHIESGMYCNTTMVDMFSVPLAIRLTGANDQTTGTLTSGARARIFDELRGHETFGPLVLEDRRVLAPGHGLDAGLFPADYFDPYVDRVWSEYAGRDLLVTTNAGQFTGRVSGDQLVFTGPAQVSFNRPPTRDVLFCDGTLAAPNDGTTGPVAAVLAAALNRGTAISNPNQPATDPATFYQEEPAHHYARVMHEASEDGRAYGFAFDDVAGFASYIEDGAPQSFTLTLTPF